MKRQDRKTQNLMTRIALPLFFGALFIAPLLNNHAQAKNDAVQQWIQTERVNIAIRTDVPAGDIFADKIKVDHIATNIRFDPRDLDASSIGFGASFIPVDPPGKRKVDEDTLRASAMRFESESIRSTGDTTFDVVGIVYMNTAQQRVQFPLTIAYGGVQQQQPVLIFSGDMNLPAGQLAPQLGLPKYLLIRFAFETIASP